MLKDDKDFISPIKPVAMCFDCMVKAGYNRDKGCHTAVIKHCSGCDMTKPILPKRHWRK